MTDAFAAIDAAVAGVGARMGIQVSPVATESAASAVVDSGAVLELSGVQAIDTAGAAVLVEVWMAGRERGRHVVLCAPSPSVVELFRLGGFEQILHDCCPSPQAARDRLAGEGRRS